LQVEEIVADALKRPRDPSALPDLPALSARLDAVFDLAMSLRLPGQAAKAIEIQSRLLGLMIEKSATAILHMRAESTSLVGDTSELRRQAIEDLREMLGSSKADKIVALIEGKAEPVEDEDGDQ
jgi:hypothetical protein